VTDILEDCVVPMGDGEEERFDMVEEICGSFPRGGALSSAIARGAEQRSLASRLIWAAEF
jgi:hypothetical protein